MPRILLKVHSTHIHLPVVIERPPFHSKHSEALKQNLLTAMTAWRSTGKTPVFKAYSESMDEHDHILFLPPGGGVSFEHFSTEVVFWQCWKDYLEIKRGGSRQLYANIAVDAKTKEGIYCAEMISTVAMHYKFYAHALKSCPPSELLKVFRRIDPIQVAGISVGMEITLRAGTIDNRPLINLLEIDDPLKAKPAGL